MLKALLTLYHHDYYPNQGITTQVFGIALDPKFDIQEGGTNTLDDKWKLEDPEKPILDESYWSKRYGNSHGWTFIVNLKERKAYPTSDQLLKIFAWCPEIKNLSVEFGKCTLDEQDNLLKRKAIFAVSRLDRMSWPTILRFFSVPFNYF